MTDDTALFSVAIPLIGGEEGCRLTAYQDTRGIWTIGWGRADAGVTEGMTCTQAQADQWRLEKLTQTAAGLDAAIPWWRSLTIPRQAVFLSMAYQMGVHGLLEFQNTLAAVRSGNFLSASSQMLLSDWAEQTPERARALANIMRTGVIA